MVEIMMVTGKTVLFGRPADIEGMFGMVLAIAQQAKSSLIIPPGVIPPGPHQPELD